ncbi:peptide/nickel transport system permease protein [Micromonospora viridifaciens]|uniref:Peptide/nickel transport system permease protein n=1 Tax=Micromonospora viridifaciens TaxID=1881 RepID=A0A1C4WS63_MICVI|nr:ABC transporter permease [Micromonospora viridifaciens]SCE99052.1 peptide/nickel transport system permease protein [Micromonospora viridifaciens]
MLRLILRRLASAVLVLLLASIVIFTVISVSGDPLAELRDRQPPVPESVIAAEEARLGLNDPLPVRYLTWLSGVVTGNFGPSTIATRNIGAELGTRVGVTLRLVLLAIVLALVLSLIAGTVSALHQRRWPDLLMTPAAFVLLALPSFWLAVLLKQWGIGLNNLTGYQLFYTVGEASVPRPAGLALVADIGGHLVLPTIVLALVHFATWSRYQRTAVAEALAGDHVRFAVLKGLTRRRIIRSYVVRPALIPIVTIVALDLPVVFSGAVITETVFQWRGMGGFLLESIALRDTNAVLAWLLIAATAVVVFNLLADILYGLVDPRVRYAKS